MNLFEAELAFDEDDPVGYHTAYLRTAPILGGKNIAFNVFELPPGQSVCPYHYESTEEEWIIVLTGRPTVRTCRESEVISSSMVTRPPGTVTRMSALRLPTGSLNPAGFLETVAT